MCLREFSIHEKASTLTLLNWAVEAYSSGHPLQIDGGNPPSRRLSSQIIFLINIDRRICGRGL
jgi:hypothetical protein